ncbi:hypothetical protein PR202_gb18335 [Eleusine coracana subsp. coracana]|uniref:WD repeat-containing protein 6 n=1 Tax=Eleusine coracana subsp. coracana TaxID=191504 RepID=A0AAV5F304_ELECO|nr:hypothetical protein PR202_gb18335 [Eleusine coracana subsp. coracana]
MAAGGHLRPGSYLGDVSALSFLPSSPRPSSSPACDSIHCLRLIAAGTGSELLMYEVGASRLLASFQVFDGVRVHGIEPRGGDPGCSNYSLAVFGEKRVKLFSLGVCVDAEDGKVGEPRLELEQRLPGFDHWVLDARFLEVDGLLAVGLSDNSVALWDLNKRLEMSFVFNENAFHFQVTFHEEDHSSVEIQSQHKDVSQILIWKLAAQIPGSSSYEGEAPGGSNYENAHLSGKQYMAVHLGRLKEHEGSIFRIAWSADGSKFMSVSDDRSARIWRLRAQSQGFVSQEAKQANVEIIPEFTLFGHSARIWDCYISESVSLSDPSLPSLFGKCFHLLVTATAIQTMITAGEDCTCCIWGMDGKLIKIFKEHIGRGIWRCLYDPGSLLLVTAGFDSAIKLQYPFKDKTVSDDQSGDAEVFIVSSPTVTGQHGPLDSYIFTADPRGVLKLWNVRDAIFSNATDSNAAEMVLLVAVFESSFGARIMCLDASPRAETGGDGCICFFKYGRSAQKTDFFGMRQVKELGTIQSIHNNVASVNQLCSTYAIGFTSADFIIWDLENETKMVQISCGGWRRPYSYYLGKVPEHQNCFAFVKDQNIHIHRHWVPTQDKKLLPQVLHLQFHGREVHSLCFIDPSSYSKFLNSSDLRIATGCEDGTVRLTCYSSGSSGSWHSSKLLGEHVGGSAVRDTCFIPKTYTLSDISCNGTSNDIVVGDIDDDTFLLISVGSKQVLTTWILQPRIADDGQGCVSASDVDSKKSSEGLETSDLALSFQWLSTHMPQKLTRNRLKASHAKQNFQEGNSSVVQPNISIMDQMENDWRYLSVTAFLLKHLATKLTVCFVVVACSDATVVLRALLLPSRLWFDVALLVPQASPVLVLRHIIVNASQYKDNAGDRYIIMSGSTDGSITFWNDWKRESGWSAAMEIAGKPFFEEEQ